MFERTENPEGELKGLVASEQLLQVDERMGELEEWAGKQLQQARGGIAKLDADAGRLYIPPTLSNHLMDILSFIPLDRIVHNAR